MRRFLFVTPSYAPFTGGAQAFQEAMARHLVAAGHEVMVLTTNAGRPADFWRPPAGKRVPLPAAEIIDGVRVQRLPLCYPWPAPYAFGLLRRAGYWLQRSPCPVRLKLSLLVHLARSMPPLADGAAAIEHWTAWADLVQATDSSWDGLFSTAARAATRQSKPFVAVPLMHLGAPDARTRFGMAHQVDAYLGAAAVVALSEREANAYRSLGVNPRRIHRVAMGVNEAPLPEDRVIAGWRERCDVSRPFVAFLGANTCDKGAFTLALAIGDLNLAGVDVDLVCAGPQHEELAAFLLRQPPKLQRILSERVHLLGLVDDDTKNCLLAACELLALPSRVDSFGIVILEAWLHGKPVIGADAGGIPDLVGAERTGLLVPFQDVEALAAAIRRLLTDRELALRLGAAGRREVLEHYTWDRTYGKMRQIYEEVGGYSQY